VFRILTESIFLFLDDLKIKESPGESIEEYEIRVYAGRKKPVGRRALEKREFLYIIKCAL